MKKALSVILVLLLAVFVLSAQSIVEKQSGRIDELAAFYFYGNAEE